MTINEFTEEFVDQQPDFFMDSLEVDSLFTNIPLESTIEIYKNKQESQTNKHFRHCLWLLKIGILFLMEHFINKWMV